MSLISIKHRFTGAVLYERDCDSIKLTVEAAISAGANLREANLYEANLYEANLRVANLRKANLHGANLSGANLNGANLSGANLRWTDLSRADLSGADLSGANLREANLYGANLREANLYGANLRWADLSRADLIDAGQDARGYRFIAQKNGDGMNVMAGCNHFVSIAAARTHWESRHENNPGLRAECLAKLDLIDATAKARGWVAAKQQAA